MSKVFSSKKSSVVTQSQFYEFSYKAACRVATTGNGTLSSAFARGQSIDDVALATGDRILIKNQSSGAENGIYTVNASGVPTRAEDFNASSEVTGGAFVNISEGTSNGNKSFVLTTNDVITLGTTALVFSEITSTPDDGSVITSKIADEAVTLAKMAHAAANTVLVRDANSTGDPIFKTVANTQILIGDGTGFTAAALSGDVAMTNAGAVTIQAGAVETSMIADEAVTLAKMAHAAANTVLVRDANSTGDPIFKALTNTQILIGDGTGFTAAALSGDVAMTNAGAVTIQAGAVEISMIADEAVTLAKMAHAAANTVLVRDANSIGDPSFKALTNTQILIGNGTGFTAAELSGDVAMANTGSVTIQSEAVETSMIKRYGGSGAQTTNATQVLGWRSGRSNAEWYAVANVCFLKGTKITLPDFSQKNIEDLCVGEMILTYQINGLSNLKKDKKHEIMNWSQGTMEGTLNQSKIRNMWVNPTDRYLVINDKLRITNLHIIHVKRDNEYKFLPAEKAQIGDLLFTDKGEYEPITDIKQVNERTEVYNIGLHKHRTYFADNYLVHHLCETCSGLSGRI